MNAEKCQIHCLQSVVDELGLLEILLQRPNRVKRALKRRWRYLQNAMLDAGLAEKPLDNAPAPETTLLEAGDLVRVRSWNEIGTTLNRWNQLKGCAFMEEMQPYCGTVQRVFKRVDKFLDERDYLMKKTKNIYLLRDVLCEGTKDFGPCDRSCFFFWRREWLEKLDPDAGISE